MVTHRRVAMSQRNRGDLVLDVVIYAAICAIVVSVVFPFWSLFVASLSKPFDSTQIGFRLLPSSIDFSAYREVLGEPILARAYLNTTIRTTAGTVLTVIVTFCGAYALSQKGLPLRRPITLLIILTMFFSGGLIPQYLLVRGLGLLDTFGALILPVLVSPFALIVMRNFMYAIPGELQESAYIDGANDWVIAWRIILPLSMPVIATVALWTAVAHWNAWFDALIYTISDSMIVLQMLVRRIVIEQDIGLYESDLVFEERVSPITTRSIRSATLFVSIGPIVAIYPFIQRYFMKGIMIGSIKA